MSLRNEIIAFYRSALRVSRNWTAIEKSNTASEREFIKSTARKEVEALAKIESAEVRGEKLKKLNHWLETSVHYRIPYSKPYHLPIGSMAKSAKAKMLNR